MIKRGLREVAVQTTNRKGVEAAVGIARTVLPLNQDVLIVPNITLVILTRRIR
jgi:hypothetical protein